MDNLLTQRQAFELFAVLLASVFALGGALLMLLLITVKVLMSQDRYREHLLAGENEAIKTLQDELEHQRDDNRKLLAALLVESNKPVHGKSERTDHAEHYANNREKIVTALIDPLSKAM